MYRWKKTVSLRHAEAWIDRVRQTISAERIALVSPAGNRTQRLEVYLDTEAAAGELIRRFGGSFTEIQPESWLPSPATSLGKPFSFGRQLLVTGHADELARLRADQPERHVLCIPAAMAFGTGEHATTAMCLRFLADVSKGMSRAGNWTLLDLGSGSGVLALAGRMYGATEVSGLDNDRHAVRISRENAALNGITKVRFQRADLLRPPWPTRRQADWSVITANLFSELHISLLPRVVPAMANGGWFIASGILATQASEVEAAVKKHGLKIMTKRRRGRWMAYLAQKVSFAAGTAAP